MSMAYPDPDTPYGHNFGPEWLVRFSKPETHGEIITFYSYKGGTGRSMALANCAGLMAEQWPENAKPLLLIDFDLEAPGLHYYLREYLPPSENLEKTDGTLELFEALAAQTKNNLRASKKTSGAITRLDDIACQELVVHFDFSPYLIETKLKNIWLIKAGRFDEKYAKRLADMDWQKLYASAPGIFRALAARWAKEYACTMIDARTGLSDTSGICTMLLPDVLTVIFTPNRQSLSGVKHIVKEAQEYRSKSVDLRPLRVYPLPSRVEHTSEDYRQTWRSGNSQHHVFGNVDGYQVLFENLLNEGNNFNHPSPALDMYFDKVQIPHSPDYAYGERLCFGPQVVKDRLSLRSAFEAFLPWLASAAQPWQSPKTCLDEWQLIQFFDSLEPPQETGATEKDENDFAAWLDRLPSDSTDPGLSKSTINRSVLALLNNASMTSSELLTSLLPQAVLILALEKIKSKQWGVAENIFKHSHDEVHEHGLLRPWESVPRRWLQHQTKTKLKIYMDEWLSSDCAQAMQEWVAAAELNIAEKWKWLDTLTGVFQRHNQFQAQAIELSESVLLEKTTLLGSDHPETLSHMEHLAISTSIMGNYSAARLLHEKVLAIRTQTLGKQHSDTLSSMNNLASVLRDSEDYQAARRLLEEVLEIRTRAFGPEHPDTLSCMNSLAALLHEMGDFRAEKNLYENIQGVLHRTAVEEHVNATSGMHDSRNFSNFIAGQETAQNLQKFTLDKYIRTLGKEHPDTLNTMNNLAISLEDIGDHPAARRLYEEILEIRTRTLGEEHPDTLRSMNNLATALTASNDMEAAFSLREKLLPLSSRILGPAHEDTQATLSAMFLAAQTKNNSKIISNLIADFPEEVKILFSQSSGSNSSAASGESNSKRFIPASERKNVS